MVLKYITENQNQTKKLGEFLAKEIMKKRIPKKTVLLCLEGDLGGGKTTFLQGFAKGLRIKEKILSPTFVIMRKFSIPNSVFRAFYHFDCYRIQNQKEFLGLNFKKIVSDRKNVIAIEWADRIKNTIPSNNVWIKFKFINKNRREITIRT